MIICRNCRQAFNLDDLSKDAESIDACPRCDDGTYEEEEIKMLEHVLTGGTYTNKKNGKVYYVLFKAVHTETHEDMVVYTRRIPDDDKRIWIRPLELFKEKFEI